jgi:hypothetical protein
LTANQTSWEISPVIEQQISQTRMGLAIPQKGEFWPVARLAAPSRKPPPALFKKIGERFEKLKN